MVLTTIVAKAVQLSGTEAGTIYTFDESRQEFRLRAAHGMDEAGGEHFEHAGAGEAHEGGRGVATLTQQFSARRCRRDCLGSGWDDCLGTPSRAPTFE